MTLTQDQINDLARALSVLVVGGNDARDAVAQAFFTPLIILGVSDETQQQVSAGASRLLESYVEILATAKPKP